MEERKERRYRVYAQIDQRMLAFGFPRNYFYAVLIFAFGSFGLARNLFLSLGFAIVSILFLRHISKDDPDFIPIFLAAWRMPIRYDQGFYRKFTVVREK